MSVLKANLTIGVSERIRRIAAVRENAKGDVYVTVFTLRVGDEIDGPEVQELRISLHPSWKSKDAATIKYVVRLRNGHYEDVTSATSSVRNLSDNLFFPILFMHLTDLSAPMYDFEAGQARKGEEYHEWPSFDPTTATITLSIFVGAPYIKFPAENCVCLRAKNFQIVFFIDYFNVPSSLHGHTMIVHTQRPEMIADPELQRATAALIAGVTPAEVVIIKDWFRHSLMMHHLRKTREIYGVDQDLVADMEIQVLETLRQIRDQMSEPLQRCFAPVFFSPSMTTETPPSLPPEPAA